MLKILNPWKYGTIGLGIALLLCMAWALRLDGLRGSWEKKFNTLDGQAQTVLMATRQATNNPDLKWPAVPQQITELAAANLALKSSINLANSRVDSLNAETLRLKTAGDGLRLQLADAQRDRAVFVAKLDALAALPGDRGSCPALLSQTQDALNLAWEAGL